MKPKIAVADIGCGNIGAVANMLRRVADSVRIAITPERVGADRIVLPGVGVFDSVARSFAGSRAGGCATWA
jgi:imidazoleglycerol phosphate synthase glutamine amidotransferase subunit HisH